MILFKNANVIFPDSIVKCDLLVRDGKIAEIGDNLSADGAAIKDADALYLSAGLIDLHCHGGGGYSAMGEISDILKMADAHLKNGVTSILPTSLAADFGMLEETVRNIREAQKINPNILGAHLEGPFLSPEMSGAQSTQLLSIPAKTDYKPFFERNADIIRMVGAAPELDGALELGDYLSGMGTVVSIAHSSGDYDTAVLALGHGYTDITHIYNACTSCHKEGAFRRGGTVEAGFTDDGFTVQVIADLRHLPAELLKLIYKCKGADRMYLISDGLEFSASDISDGQTVVQKNGVKATLRNSAMLTADLSRLAGSIASGIELVKNIYRSTDASLPEAMRMMTLTPAKVIGVDSHKGKIERGYDADLILFDGDFNIRAVCQGGVIKA